MRHGRFLALVVMLAAGPTPACTTVLGMERATLDPDAGAGGAGGGSVMQPGGGAPSTMSVTAWATTCSPTQECTNCLQTMCAANIRACLGKSDCRAKLDSYARCVQSKGCGSSIDCAETKLGEQGSDEAKDVASCLLADTCGKQCDGTVLATKCELYCDCMAQSCSSQFSKELGAARDACILKCVQLEPKNADCRWEHCEYASLDPVHCEHAMDRGACGFADDKANCLDGQEVGFPCKIDDDCCSGNCSGNVCR